MTITFKEFRSTFHQCRAYHFTLLITSLLARHITVLVHNISLTTSNCYSRNTNPIRFSAHTYTSHVTRASPSYFVIDAKNNIRMSDNSRLTNWSLYRRNVCQRNRIKLRFVRHQSFSGIDMARRAAIIAATIIAARTATTEL